MSDNLDPFALAREDDSEHELLTAYRLLPPDKAAAAVKLLRWSAGLDNSDDTAPLPKQAEPVKREQNTADIDRLRCACEELAAEYRAPLPEGDAGLVAAVERWRTMRRRPTLTERGFHLTMKTEKEIAIPTAYAAEEWLESFIEETPAQGLIGVAAKLRYAVEFDGLVDFENLDGEQLVEVIEREIGRATR